MIKQFTNLLVYSVLLTLPAGAQADQYGDFTYSVYGSKVYISKYTGLGGMVAIPDTIAGFPVAVIQDNAFMQSHVVSVTIPNTVTAIGMFAFGGCTNLLDITIPNSVTLIGTAAFIDCTGLTSLTIPGSVTTFGSVAFERCYGLTNVTILSGVTRIGQNGFTDCTNLITITIPSSVTTIESGAFFGCTRLQGVYFNGNAPSLDNGYVFYNATNATVYYIPGTSGWGTTFSGRPVAEWINPPPPFSYSTNNGGITITGYTGVGGAAIIPNIINGLPVTSIGNYAFAGCAIITNAIIPDSVTNIGAWAFYSCANLASVTIGNGVRSIENAAFYYCTSLCSLTIGSSVTSIGDSAFSTCTSLTSVTIPDSVTSIGYWSFDSCTRITSVTIGNSVTNIGGQAFGSCYLLSGVFFQGNAPVADSCCVFYGNNVVTVYYPPETTGWGSTFGDRPTMLWPWTFTADNGSIAITGYNGSASVEIIPDTVTGLPITRIGTNLFSGNSSLTNITVSGNVTSIGAGAFSTCSSLTRVFFQGNAPSLDGTNVFAQASNATIYYYEGTTGWAPTFGGLQTRMLVHLMITDQSWDLNNLIGTTARFFVSATGNEPLSYQWQINGTNLMNGGDRVHFSDPVHELVLRHG